MSALRPVTAAISLGLIALAFYDDRFVGGGPGFGVSQSLLLALGVAIGALCAAPRVWNARALTLLFSVALTLGAAELELVHQFTERGVVVKIYKLDPAAQPTDQPPLPLGYVSD